MLMQMTPWAGAEIGRGAALPVVIWFARTFSLSGRIPEIYRLGTGFRGMPCLDQYCIQFYTAEARVSDGVPPSCPVVRPKNWPGGMSGQGAGKRSRP